MADVRISARSTLGALNKWVEVISGNMTGSQIAGYKATRITFGDSLVDIVRGGSGNTGTLGGINPVQIGSGGISVGGTTTDFRQGSLLQTGNNTDLAIQGNAFFTTADSSGKIIYTRNGETSFDDQGYLVTKEGQFVLGVFDRTRDIIRKTEFKDIDAGAVAIAPQGVTVDFSAGNFGYITGSIGTGAAVSFNGIFDSTETTGTQQSTGGLSHISTYFTDPATPNSDRINGRIFVPAGRLSVALNGATNAAGAGISSVGGVTIGIIAGVTISLYLTDPANTTTRTSTDNARLIATAINSYANQTGIAASVIVNLNDQNQATLVLGHVNRVISESYARLPINKEGQDIADIINKPLEGIIATQHAGLVDTFKDNKGNLFYKINALALNGNAPQYVPATGDNMHFDSNGTMINDSKGKDATSAPPFNSGVHVVLSKFSNSQGLEKRRGGSQFIYTEATGAIAVGYAGLSKTSQISTKQGIEFDGISSIGAENTIIGQALESSNSSITDSLPELTVAQKTFTSNTKVINVGNTIVDDLNGLIR
ncbi:MAG: flagellar hook-basal body complex protein [Candidatus Sericytochromatia bacterium]|nr:flagellar hook-basal body complex protein [Candidatus Sericytochromatia bacterium]